MILHRYSPVLRSDRENNFEAEVHVRSSATLKLMLGFAVGERELLTIACCSGKLP
jgi:hypothetical protein